MSQQKNQKNIVVYNYDPHPKQIVEQPVIKQESIVDESPFNVSKILRAKQQHSNIFNLPQQDFSKVTLPQNPEKILPYDVFWWNSQNLKENKKTENQGINVQLAQSRPQTAHQLTEEQFLEIQQQQYQQFLQQKNNQHSQVITNPYQVIKQHNDMIETAQFAEQKQVNDPPQQNNQLQNPAKVYDKINNPNVELKQRNPNFSDVFGNGLEKYYQQKPQQNSAKKQLEYMEESELYGAKYHQRQMLKGMSSQMDTHKYYDEILDKQNQDQIKSKQPKSASHSPSRSPAKNLEQDEKLFPKSLYTELVIRGMGKEVNWEKLNTQLTSQQMLLADVTVVQDKNGKIKQHKIIIKHYDATKLSIIKQWVLTQGGRLVEEKNLSSEEEFVKLMKLKEGPKQRPVRITEEKEKLKQQKKRPQSAAVVQKPKQKK